MKLAVAAREGWSIGTAPAHLCAQASVIQARRTGDRGAFDLSAASDANAADAADATHEMFEPGEFSANVSLTVLDARSWASMEILLDPQESELIESDAFDPHWLAARRARQPLVWPVIGRAGRGWTFCTIAQTGEPVCPLTLTIESSRTALIWPMAEALGLSEAHDSVRLQAGALVERCVDRMGALDANHRDYMTGLVALLSSGALLPSGPSALTTQLISFMATPDKRNGLSHRASRSNQAGQLGQTSSAPHEMQIEATLRTSFLACMLLAAECSHGGGEAFCEAIRQDPSAALAYREPAGSTMVGSGVLHVCVLADRPAELVAVLDILGHDAARALDGDGLTALQVATARNHGHCELVLLAHHARHAANCALMVGELA